MLCFLVHQCQDLLSAWLEHDSLPSSELPAACQCGCSMGRPAQCSKRQSTPHGLDSAGVRLARQYSQQRRRLLAAALDGLTSQMRLLAEPN